MSKQILTVFGSTGNQGGNVIDTLLNSSTLVSKYTIRAVTRDVNKESAKALASKGCELVAADINDLESVKNAVKGSHAVFAVTNFWDDMQNLSKEKEFKQGKNLVDASKAEGVKHLVWSSLAHASTISEGKLTGVHHFDSKAEVEQHAERIKGDMIVSYFMPGVYMSNFKGFVNRGPDGKLAMAAPLTADANYPMFDPSTDSGKYVLPLFEAGSKADGVHIQAVGQWMKPTEIVATLSKAAGEEIAFIQVPPEVFEGFLPPAIAHELTQNMQLIGEFDYYGKGAPEKQAESDKWLFEGVRPIDFEEFVKKNGPWKW